MRDSLYASAILDRINWDFSNPFSIGRSGAKLFDTRKHHWYPATFIAELPYSLIDVLSKPGGSVYDPFSGIGTTLFQALQLGRVPFGTELNRVTVDFMHSLWRLIGAEWRREALLAEWQELRLRFDNKTNYAPRMKKMGVLVEKLRPWFSDDTFQQILFAGWIESQEKDVAMKAALRITLSNLLKSVCAQDRGWGCVADNVLPNSKQLALDKHVFDLLGKRISILLQDTERMRHSIDFDTLKKVLSEGPETHIFQIDVKGVNPIPDESIDLIVTSPPYPNMSDYSMSQRLSYYWLGLEPDSDCLAEIGARRRRTRASSLTIYLEGMKVAEESFCKKLKLGGYACLVMPEFEGDKWNNAARKRVVQECLAHLLNCGLVQQHELQRILPTRRRHHNQKWTTLEREHIYIFERVA